MKTKQKAIKLAWMLGLIGGHNFYLKQWFWGGLKLFFGGITIANLFINMKQSGLFGATILSLIIYYFLFAVLDILKLKKMDDEAFDARYNSKEYMQRKMEEQRLKLETIEQEFQRIGLQECSVDISMPKGETCYYILKEVNWKEPRKVTRSASYAGLNQRINLGKGISFRAGNITPIRHVETEYQVIESGTLYVTNKRIMLSGVHGSKTISLDKLIDITSLSDGVLIQRDTGKNIFFPMGIEDNLKISLVIDKIKE